jgi:hypothetical protein
VPAFAEHRTRQHVVSNGDLPLIRHSINQWGLANVLHVVHRNADEDKGALLRARARPGVVTFDDTDRYLQIAETAGALAIGIRHQHNPHNKLTTLTLPIRCETSRELSR